MIFDFFVSMSTCVEAAAISSLRGSKVGGSSEIRYRLAMTARSPMTALIAMPRFCSQSSRRCAPSSMNYANNDGRCSDFRPSDDPGLP
jgi:hypothetical protein